jgi:hypothetical protein
MMNAREFDEMPTTSLGHHIKTGGEIPVLLKQLSLSNEKITKTKKELQHIRAMRCGGGHRKPKFI